MDDVVNASAWAVQALGCGEYIYIYAFYSCRSRTRESGSRRYRWMRRSFGVLMWASRQTSLEMSWSIASRRRVDMRLMTWSVVLSLLQHVWACRRTQLLLSLDQQRKEVERFDPGRRGTRVRHAPRLGRKDRIVLLPLAQVMCSGDR